MRLRFSVQKRIAGDAAPIWFKIGDRDVRLLPREKEARLSDAKDLVMIATGFETADAAAKIGQTLSRALRVYDAHHRMGIDIGEDIATAQFGQIAKEAINRGGGVLRDDVHGIDVYEDTGREVFLRVEIHGTVSTPSDVVVARLQGFATHDGELSGDALGALVQLNAAISASSDMAKMALAVSAIEGLGQSENWSSSQKAVLESLRGLAASDPSLTQIEQVELAEAIERGVFKVSLRQGVMRLFDRLDLGHLRKQWDTAYALRSGVIHGTKPLSRREMSTLAEGMLVMAQTVVLRYIGGNRAD